MEEYFGEAKSNLCHVHFLKIYIPETIKEQQAIAALLWSQFLDNPLK